VQCRFTERAPAGIGAITNATTAIACALILFGVAMSQQRVTPADQART
jgi:hypothetical protein